MRGRLGEKKLLNDIVLFRGGFVGPLRMIEVYVRRGEGLSMVRGESANIRSCVNAAFS